MFDPPPPSSPDDCDSAGPTPILRSFRLNRKPQWPAAAWRSDLFGYAFRLEPDCRPKTVSPETGDRRITYVRNRLLGIFAATTCVRSTTSATWKSTPMLASENASSRVSPFSSTRKFTASSVAEAHRAIEVEIDAHQDVMRGRLRAWTGNRLALVQHEAEHASDRLLERVAADLAVALRAVWIADIEQRARRGTRGETACCRRSDPSGPCCRRTDPGGVEFCTPSIVTPGSPAVGARGATAMMPMNGATGT